MNVTMIGAGYVGLVTGACFAEFGFNVTVVDKDEKRIQDLHQGIMPIYEPGLDSLVHQGVKANLLHFTKDLKSAVSKADVVMIAVGTPSIPGDGHVDLSYVYQAAKDIAKAINKYTIIVTKSTVPVGTSQKVAEIIEETRPDLKEGIDFDVASNPEFLREGSAINDFMRPDRVVVGTHSLKVKEIMQKLYRPLYLIETPMVFTTPQTSELIKYAANGFLALKIAFINQMADICEKADADVKELAKGIGLDNRINRKFLNVSPGYGGSCFPKDTLALSQTAKDLGTPCTIIDAVIESNYKRKENIANRIIKKIKERNLSSPSVALLGITFKPNTDDMRDASSLVIVPKLLEAGIQVKIYDPIYYKDSPRFSQLKAQGVEWPEVYWACNRQDAIQNSDAIIILTEWNTFRGMDLDAAQLLLNKTHGFSPLMFDFRNIFKPNEVKGWTYISLGRKEIDN